MKTKITTKTIKKKHLVNYLLAAKKLQHLNKFQVTALIENIFTEIIQILETGEDFKIQNFGRFSLVDKAERPGRNPKTGESIPVEARSVVIFSPSKNFKEGIKRRFNSKNFNYANDTEMQDFYLTNYGTPKIS